MSELAFDANGDPITFPADAEELRVRRFRNPGMRGACEVVHERDGAPLYVPVDTSYVEFRTLVDGVPGRYRLDPVDAARRVITNSLPAYITITEPARNAGMSGSADDRDSVIRELARANAEMTRTIADRFANVMQAAADLLRAADGAGLPRREPPPPVPPEDDDEDDDDDDDDAEREEDAAPDIASLIAQILPTIQMWLAARTAEKTAAAPPAAASASPPVPGSAPAHAAATVVATDETDAAAGWEPVATSAAVTAAVTSESSGSATAGSGAPMTMGTDPAIGPSPDGEVRNAAQAPSPSQTAHLLAIYAGLSPAEKRIAQLVVARMTPEVRARWLDELSLLTVDQAVDLVRSMIPRGQRRKEGDS